MKTLNEVIKAYEICMSDESKTTNCKGCPYADETGDPLCFGEDKEDALHYLKEYRKRLIQDLDELRQKKYELETNMKLDAILQLKPWEKRK